ncbi:hypothetical protein ACI65C_013436 [Semiaphis heraclei]
MKTLAQTAQVLYGLCDWDCIKRFESSIGKLKETKADQMNVPNENMRVVNIKHEVNEAHIAKLEETVFSLVNVSESLIEEDMIDNINSASIHMDSLEDSMPMDISVDENAMIAIETDMQRLVQWINIVGLKNLDPVSVYNKKFICEKHFSSDCSSPGTKRLKANAYPSINLTNLDVELPICTPQSTVNDVSSGSEIVGDSELNESCVSGIHLLDTSFINNDLIDDSDALVSCSNVPFANAVNNARTVTKNAQPCYSPKYTVMKKNPG